MRYFCLFALMVSCIAIAPASAAEPKTKSPIKVFILAGQSNMQGHGVIASNPRRNGGQGSLEYLVKNPKSAQRFKHLVDSAGKWIQRDDVNIWYMERKGKLTAGYGANEERIGPELQFGHAVGKHFDEPVLLIKIAWGGKSLAVDFRPPSSGKIPYDVGKGLATQIKKDPKTLGRYYRLMFGHIRTVLGDLKKQFPEYAGRDYEVVGFGWHQGWNDRVNQSFNDEYEKNLANFIRDVRKELKIEKLPFVIAETGMSGFEEKHPRAVSLMKAQAAVAQHKEFRGNVAFVSTRPFFRKKDVSPSGQAYHWNTNAETYFLIGDGMAKAMLKLVKD